MRLFPKLTLTFSSLLIVAIACLSGSFYWAEQRSIRAQASAEQQAILQNLVHIAQESFLTNDDLLLVKYTHWLAKWNPAMVSASVVDPQGQVLAHSEPSRIGKPLQDGIPESERAQVLVLTQAIHLGAQWMGNASVAFSQRSLDELLHQRLEALQKRLVEVVLVSLGMSLAVCFLLALSWTRPIGFLATMAERIGRGQWDVNLGSMEKRRDELGFLARSFYTMAEQLRELDRMKEDFVSAVTHELRSPLGAIESYLNVISQELPQGISNQTWEMYLQRLRMNTQRLTRFVNDLLDVAALERGSITLERKVLPIGPLIQNVIDLFAAKLHERRVTCEIQVPPLLPAAYGDPDKVHQVLVNLISNAIKFTPDNGHLLIQAEASPSQKLLQISVTDTGIGIAEADQAKLFNKFEQVKSARLSVKGPKGTGLGLAISRKLVEMQGGSIGVRSQPGKGSTFFFTIPLADTTVCQTDTTAVPVG